MESESRLPAKKNADVPAKKSGPNALSNVVKEKLADLINKEIDNLPQMLSELEPRQRVEAIAKFLPYVTPKMSERAVSTKINVTVQDELKKLSGKDMKLEPAEIPDAEIIEDDFGLTEESANHLISQ